jgi:hypothetical protein
LFASLHGLVTASAKEHVKSTHVALPLFNLFLHSTSVVQKLLVGVIWNTGSLLRKLGIKRGSTILLVSGKVNIQRIKIITTKQITKFTMAIAERLSRFQFTAANSSRLVYLTQGEQRACITSLIAYNPTILLNIDGEVFVYSKDNYSLGTQCPVNSTPLLKLNPGSVSYNIECRDCRFLFPEPTIQTIEPNDYLTYKATAEPGDERNLVQMLANFLVVRGYFVLKSDDSSL